MIGGEDKVDMKHIKHAKKFSDRVFITNSSLYGKYNNRDVALHAAELTELTLRVLDQHLLIPDHIKYLVTKIPHNHAQGVFNPEVDQVTVDSRLSDSELIKAVCHESVHVDQVARGDLSWVNGEVFWLGECYGNIAHQSYKQYMNTPWELEAFQRHDSLLSVVIQSIPQSNGR